MNLVNDRIGTNTNVKKFLAIIIASSCLALFAATAGAQTLVPRDKIPSGTPANIKELIELLYNSNEAVVARAAANLGGLENQATASIPFLIGLLYDDTALQIIPAHLSHLCSRNPNIPCGIKGDSTTVSRVVATALARMGEPALQPLLDAFISGQPNRNYGKDRKVQEAAAHALGLLKNQRAVEPLLRAFGDPSMKDVRGSTALALGEIGDARAVEPLIAALRDDTVRSQAIEALGNLRDRRALEPLLELLARPGIQSRWLLGDALLNMGKPRPMDRLIPLLKSSDESIVEVAVLTLGKIGAEDKDQSVIPLLAPYINNQYTVGTYAVTYLRKLASWELNEIKDQAAIDALITAVGNHDTEASIVAAEILGAAKVQRALPAIANAVIFSSIDSPIHVGGYSNTGVTALKKLNLNAAIEYMIALALDKKCGTTAECDRIFSALRRITGQDLWGGDAVAWQRWWNRNKPRATRPGTRRR
jgi:HEAT repeat protein